MWTRCASGSCLSRDGNPTVIRDGNTETPCCCAATSWAPRSGRGGRRSWPWHRACSACSLFRASESGRSPSSASPVSRWRCTGGAAAPAPGSVCSTARRSSSRLLHWTGIYVGAAPWLILAGAEAGYYAGARRRCCRSSNDCRAAPLWIGAAWVLRRRCGTGGRSAASRGVGWRSARPSRRCGGSRPLGGAPLVTFAVATAGGGLAMGLLAVRRGPWRGALPSLARRPGGRAAARCGPGLAVAADQLTTGSHRDRGPRSGRRARRRAGVQCRAAPGARQPRRRRRCSWPTGSKPGEVAPTGARACGRRTPPTSTRIAIPDAAAADHQRAVDAVGVPILVGAIG